MEADHLKASARLTCSRLRLVLCGVQDGSRYYSGFIQGCERYLLWVFREDAVE